MTDLKEKIISEIKKIYDPEIPVNIYELGLIYKIEVVKGNKAVIEMLLDLGVEPENIALDDFGG